MKRILIVLMFTISYSVQAQDFYAGIYDERTPGVDSGTVTWNEDFYGGSWSQYMSLITLTATGDYARFWMLAGVGYADIEICVDADCTVFSSNVAGMSVVSYTVAIAENATITIQNSGVGLVGLDYFEILGSPTDRLSTAVQEASEQTTFEYGGTTYQGVIEARLTAGEALIILLVAGIFAVNILKFPIMLLTDRADNS